jgi:hypothetical protein
LALALGQPNPDRMLAAMPARIYDEWLAYDQTDPIGAGRGDLQAAIVSSTVDNAVKNILYALTRERMEQSRPADFMPEFRAPEPKPPKTAKELYNLLKTALMMGRGKSHDRSSGPAI